MGSGKELVWREVVTSGGVAVGMFWGIGISPEQEILTIIGAPRGYIAIYSIFSLATIFVTALKSFEHLRIFGLIAWVLGIVSGFYIGAGGHKPGLILLLMAWFVTLLGAVWYNGSASW